MFIRPPRWMDFTQILTMACDYHSNSCFAHLPFDEDRAAEGFATLVRGGPDLFARVAVRDGAVAGICVGRRAPLWFSSAWDTRQDLFYVAPGYRGSGAARQLWRALAAWSSESHFTRPMPRPDDMAN